LCIGIDVGGTFTDAVITQGPRVWRAKAPTTPRDPAAGVLAACRLAAAEYGAELEELFPRVSRFGLGTTAITNVLTARAGAPVGLLTTAGFEDTIGHARGRRTVSDGWSVPPWPVVERQHIVGIDERVRRDGRVIRPLRLDEVLSGVHRLVDRESVAAVVVSFLWSVRNPAHEEAAVEAITREFPTLNVVSGVACHPALGEYERTMTAVLNAYSMAAFAGLDALDAAAHDLGLRVPVLLLHSGGGTISLAQARTAPLGLAQSGPAGGVAASVELVGALRAPTAVTADMGGTSFDVAVIDGGVAHRTGRGELFGLSVALPRIDVESVGAGGGSLAWADDRGMLRVGPRSAGAEPGPACYGRGGDQPTITDALVVLGYIGAANFLGGTQRLEADLAHAACARLGERLGLGAVETAWGIREIALSGMVRTVQGTLARNGLDPERTSVVSYGGCGGLFTSEIALALGLASVEIPEIASVLSAFGAASADVRRERIAALNLGLPGDAAPIRDAVLRLRRHLLDDLRADGVDADRTELTFVADVRFALQTHQLAVGFDPDVVAAEGTAGIARDFFAAYRELYGDRSLSEAAAVELVAVRGIGVGRTVKSGWPEETAVEPGYRPQPSGHRDISLARPGEAPAEPVPCFDGSGLRPGATVPGPAVIDLKDTTIWVPGGTTARLRSSRTLTITAEGRPS
jgi:N-methylhydantoinase A